MNSVCAIFVTYDPDPTFVDNVKSILTQVEKVVIVDNASKPQFKKLVQSCSQIDKVNIIYNTYNMGIASALNMGVKWALERNFDWIITFDQDSNAASNLVDIILDEYNRSSKKEQIALLAPVYYDKKTGYQSRYMRLEEYSFVVTDLVITSGSMIKTSVFKEVGFFDDDLFIDYVDHDFCLRLKEKGYLSIIVPKARLAQTFGDAKRHDFWFFSFFSHNYSPARRYYMSRNRLILYRRHKRYKWWMWQDLIYAFKDLIKILAVESNKYEKIKHIILGTIDGILGRKGTIDGVNYSSPKAEKYFVEFREEIIPLLPESCEKLLDIGCGSGETSATLKKLGKAKWICGVEYNAKAAAVARTRLDYVVEGDVEKLALEFPPETFDAILTLDILEHLVDPWTILEKLSRLLKPGGVIIASIPNVRHISVVIPLLLLDDWRYQEEGLLDSTHIRFFTQKTAIKLMTSTGLKVEMIDHTGAKPGSFSGLINSLTFGLFKKFLSFQYLIKVRKPL